MREATTPLAVAGWLAVALAAHCLVALFAVLSRWAQVGMVELLGVGAS